MSKSLLRIFGCISLCGCRDRVAREMVFFPPEPSYTFRQQLVDGKEMAVMSLVDPVSKIEVDPFAHPNFSMDFIRTCKSHKIVYFHFRYPGGSDTTLIFSHSNATDLGHMRGLLLQLSHDLKCNILAYDYTGYGLSAGKPAHSHLYHDLEAIYDVFTTLYHTEHVILYGQSLGTGPTLYLARKLQSKIDGVIVHSGLMSAVRVIAPDISKTLFFDMLNNIDNIGHVVCPVLVVHGTEDEEVPINHGLALADAMPKLFPPAFIEGAGHNNIEVLFRDQLIQILSNFLKHVRSPPPPPLSTNNNSNHDESHVVNLIRSDSFDDIYFASNQQQESMEMKALTEVSS